MRELTLNRRSFFAALKKKKKKNVISGTYDEPGSQDKDNVRIPQSM